MDSVVVVVGYWCDGVVDIVGVVGDGGDADDAAVGLGVVDFAVDVVHQCEYYKC